jgi:predicted nucleotidyltransferase
LDRAIAGRGAFRRFKDTLIEFPGLREGWFAFHDARMSRRALEWLADQGVIDSETAEREAQKHPDPEIPGEGGVIDSMVVVEKTAAALRGLYGERLRKVILFGSRARGDAHPDSDFDILVVLDRVDSPWEELRRMEPVTWEIAFEHDAVVSKVPVSEEEFEQCSTPLLRSVAAEGHPVS